MYLLSRLKNCEYGEVGVESGALVLVLEIRQRRVDEEEAKEGVEKRSHEG